MVFLMPGAQQGVHFQTAAQIQPGGKLHHHRRLQYNAYSK
jgi:hypothetical protein